MTQLVIQFKFQINFVNIFLKLGQNMLHKWGVGGSEISKGYSHIKIKIKTDTGNYRPISVYI